MEELTKPWENTNAGESKNRLEQREPPCLILILYIESEKEQGEKNKQTKTKKTHNNRQILMFKCVPYLTFFFFRP